MSTHHKKLKNTVPSWLWFSIYRTVQPIGKWNEDKEQIALTIQRSLRDHLVQHDLQNDIITEPNNHDFHGIYSKNHETI